METTKEKIAYLRGLLDGSDGSLQEERIRSLFEKVLLVLDELAGDLEELVDVQEELDGYLQEVDFDLAYLEDSVYSLDEEAEEDDDWSDFAGTTTLLEVKCPQCRDVVAFDEDLLFDDGGPIRCPNCDSVVFETDELEELEDMLHEDDLTDFE